MPAMFQIHEEDLGELERTLPQLAQAMTHALDGRLRIKFRRVQAILSNIRWEYGPPECVERIDTSGDDCQPS